MFAETYGTVRWSTLPGERDLRPWLWFEKLARHPTVQPRHTAWIENLSRFTGEESLVLFSRERRRQYRNAVKRGAVLLPEITINRAKELYLEALANNNSYDVALRRMDSLESLFSLVQQGHGYVLSCGLAEDMMPRAFNLALIGKGRANAVIAASDSLWRSRDLRPFSQIHDLIRANAENAELYDYNGANSPLLSSDKHSYGAEVKMYFDLYWQ